MFYEKLQNIYRESGCQDYFPNALLDKFYDYLRFNSRSGRLYISPYKFALQNYLTINEAIQFFMFFTIKDGIFEMVYFIDCTKPQCFNRVYIDLNADGSSNEIESFVTCIECEKDYEILEIIDYIKVYFVLNTDIGEPEILKKISTSDPNSTFAALKGLPSHLKQKSPSSSSKIKSSDEGDPSVELKQLASLNQINGRTISKPFSETCSQIANYIRK